MTQEEIAQLLERYRLGLCTPAEAAAINSWADENNITLHDSVPDEKKFFERLDGSIAAGTGIPVRDQPVINISKWKNSSIRWVAAAAVIILMAGAGYFIFDNKSTASADHKLTSATAPIVPGSNTAILILATGQKINLDNASTGKLAEEGNADIIKSADGALQYHALTKNNAAVVQNTMQTPRGGQYQLILPDGTRAWLNAASTITYPTTFTAAKREVTITGEVYFDVAKNKSQPFEVHTNNMTIEVLGTQFNVNAYTNEEANTATLLQGSVRIKQAGISAILKPGQQARVKEKVTVHEANIEEAIAWQRGLFQFNNTDLRTVMRQLARWYDIDVKYEGPVPVKTFVGKLPRDASIDQVLRALSRTQVHFRVEGRQIIVTP